MGRDGGLIATVRVFDVAQRLTYPLLSPILERQGGSTREFSETAARRRDHPEN